MSKKDYYETLNLSKNASESEIKKGINEIRSNYKNQIRFTDTLKCINYKK